MPTGDQLKSNIPFLRRYARALTGSQSSGDAAVVATLEAAIQDPVHKEQLERGREGLYQVFTRLWQSSDMPQGLTALETASIEQEDLTSVHEIAAQDRLGSITPLNRQALLLTTLEEFSSDSAARILGIDREEVERLVDQAVADIAQETYTNVLIIEDEPLISMQLEDLVKAIGHKVCGTAATRTQAQTVSAKSLPGLVLADIQLADGSSGLDAVDDILSTIDVPVIFITAYPERLLTGSRPEPTYLVTKPFQEATVRAAISQALFFNNSAPIP